MSTLRCTRAGAGARRARDGVQVVATRDREGHVGSDQLRDPGADRPEDEHVLGDPERPEFERFLGGGDAEGVDDRREGGRDPRDAMPVRVGLDRRHQARPRRDPGAQRGDVGDQRGEVDDRVRRVGRRRSAHVPQRVRRSTHLTRLDAASVNAM